ncbi:MAG TPA: hypothetical protein VFO38_03235, partial [Candidatus Saccharimonadales bacterium]|nr:hypothetical protein [Candidatus Saccharimonadales bacterium]
MVERVVRDFVGISADRRREVTTLLLHAALNPATFYGGEGDACFYGRLDTTGETDFEVLSRRGILLSVAFSAEPNRGSPVRSQTSAGRSELEVAAMTSLIEFRPDEWPLCATDPKEGEEAELAYLHAVGRAA